MPSSRFFVPPTASSDENRWLTSTGSTVNSTDTPIQMPLEQQARNPSDELEQVIRAFEALSLQPQTQQTLQSELEHQLQLPPHHETQRSQSCQQLEESHIQKNLEPLHATCTSASRFTGLYDNHSSALNLPSHPSHPSGLPLSPSFPAASGTAPLPFSGGLDFLTPGAMKRFLEMSLPSSTVCENTTSDSLTMPGSVYPRSEETACHYNSSSTSVLAEESVFDKSVGKSSGPPCPPLSQSSFNDNNDSQMPTNDEYYRNYPSETLPLVPLLQQIYLSSSPSSSPSTSLSASPLDSDIGSHCVSPSLEPPADLSQQKKPINNFEALVVEFLRNNKIFTSTSSSTSPDAASLSSSTCTSTCTCGNCSTMTSAVTFSSTSPNESITSNAQPSSKNGLSLNSIGANPLTSFPGFHGNVTAPLSLGTSRNPSPPKLPASGSSISHPLAATAVSSLPCQIPFAMSHQLSLDEFVKASSLDRNLTSTLSAKLPALFENSRRISPSNSSSQGHHKSSFDSEISEETLNSSLPQQRPQAEGKRLFVKILVTEEVAELAFCKNAQELKALIEKTQTEVNLSQDGHFFPGSHKRPVAISGATESSLFAVLDFFLELLLQQSQNEPGGPTKARCAVAVPRIVIGSLIGKNGSYIQSVRLMTGAHVYVSPLFVRADEACSERLVTISSRDRGSLRAATFTIAWKINEHMANASCRSVMYHRKHMPSVPGSCSSTDTTPSSAKRQASCSFDIDVGGHVSPAVLSRSLCSTSPLLPQLPKRFASNRRQASCSFDIDKTGHVAEPSTFQIPHNLFLDDREPPNLKKPVGRRPPSCSFDDYIGYR